jgi:amino acid transporter
MATSKDHSGGLARRSVTPFEVIAQSVANIAPSAVIAFTPMFMAGSAGNGAWLSFAIGMALILIIAQSITSIARRRAGAGSLYSLIRPAIGATGSFITGWGLFVGAICIAAGSLAGAGFFASEFLKGFGVNVFDSPTGQVVLDAVILIVGIWITISGVRIAARVSATLEVISIILIVIVLVIVLAQSGNVIDTAQLSLTGATFDGMVFAVVLAILGFVGFESAASLGEEAKDPFRAIPRAIRGGAIFAGILYIFATYAQVAAIEGGAEGLAASGSPMEALANQYGLTAFVPLLNLGFAASFIAVVMACITVAGRLLFSWGNEGIIGKRFGKVHPKYRTPSFAIWMTIPIIFIPTAYEIGIVQEVPLNVTTYIDTIGVFGYMIAYLLVCIFAPVFLRKVGAKQVIVTQILGLVGAAALLYVYWVNIVGTVEPFNQLPVWFVASMIVGVGLFLVVRVRNPKAAAAAGTFADENTEKLS